MTTDRPARSSRRPSARPGSERFVRIAKLGNPGAWARWDADHEALVTAFRDRDHDAAVQTIARHLAQTALTAMAAIAPHQDAAASRPALNLLVQP